MMGKPNIVLTGFMGTGKTTIGKLLAESLGYAFIDTDERIERQAGKTIPEIFEEEGEEAFREMEAALARELAERQGVVIATGGRMMLDPGNAAALSRTGHVFCLAAAPEEILERITRDTATRRPLLAVADPMERIRSLLRQRQHGYRRFPQLVTSGIPPEAVVDILHAMLKR